jgi:hypothetical protein
MSLGLEPVNDIRRASPFSSSTRNGIVLLLRTFAAGSLR